MSRDALLLIGLVLLPGCAGEFTAIAAVVFSMSLGAWLVGRGHQRRALLEAANLRRAIATGRHRQIEQHLRGELALAAAGEAVSVERQWLARAQLGGLLVAEWRLDEAREVYTITTAKLSPHLQALAAFGRHELDVLSREPDLVVLGCIRGDRDACLRHIPEPYQPTVACTWAALEGLCLARMNRPREAVPLLERGLECLGFNPARVVYLFHLAQAHEQLGDRQLAASRYEQAMHAFPGTRLASEARARCHALDMGRSVDLFRGMLPEAPLAILVCGDREAEPIDGFLSQNCSAATENILLAAHALGLGAVWLGIYPRQERIEAISKLIGLPELVLPITLIAVGYPAEEKKTRNRFDRSKVRYNHW